MAGGHCPVLFLLPEFSTYCPDFQGLPLDPQADLSCLGVGAPLCISSPSPTQLSTALFRMRTYQWSMLGCCCLLIGQFLLLPWPCLLTVSVPKYGPLLYGHKLSVPLCSAKSGPSLGHFFPWENLWSSVPRDDPFLTLWLHRTEPWDKYPLDRGMAELVTCHRSRQQHWLSCMVAFPIITLSPWLDIPQTHQIFLGSQSLLRGLHGLRSWFNWPQSPRLRIPSLQGKGHCFSSFS